MDVDVGCGCGCDCASCATGYLGTADASAYAYTAEGDMGQSEWWMERRMKAVMWRRKDA